MTPPSSTDQRASPDAPEFEVQSNPESVLVEFNLLLKAMRTASGVRGGRVVVVVLDHIPGDRVVVGIDFGHDTFCP